MTVEEDRATRARCRTEVRDLLVLCGFEPPNGIALNSVLSQCPDVDLAFTALTMTPRPRWVREFVEPLSVSAF
jgi:hypothetical protein